MKLKKKKILKSGINFFETERLDGGGAKRLTSISRWRKPSWANLINVFVTLLTPLLSSFTFFTELLAPPTHLRITSPKFSLFCTLALQPHDPIVNGPWHLMPIKYSISCKYLRLGFATRYITVCPVDKTCSMNNEDHNCLYRSEFDSSNLKRTAHRHIARTSTCRLKTFIYSGS